MAELDSIGFAASDAAGVELAPAFAQPGTAIEALTGELLEVWDRCRSNDPNERRVGSLGVTGGAYVQWIGYSDRVVVEVSSNAFLEGAARLDDEQELALVASGFAPPDEDEPNFWLHVTERGDAARAAFAIVAALTVAFGVYAA